MKVNTYSEWFWDEEFKRYNSLEWSTNECVKMIGVDNLNNRFSHDEKGVFSHWPEEDKRVSPDMAFRCHFIGVFTQNTAEGLYFERMNWEDKVKYCSVWVINNVCMSMWAWYLKDGDKWMKVDLEQYNLL